MESFSKVILQQRKGYREVFIYYSRHGAKFRESTRVKVFDDGIVDLKGALSELLNQDDIQKLHRRVENLIRYYLIQYEEKPPCQWLRLEFNKLKIKESIKLPAGDFNDTEMPDSIEPETAHCEINTVGEDIFFYWADFIAMKRQCTRTEGTIKRYNNLLNNVRKFHSRYAAKGYGTIGINTLSQNFFNDLLLYLAKEHEYIRSTVKSDSTTVELPEIGLSNETIIKRVTDLVEYLSYCKRRKDVVLDLEEIQEYVKIAKFKLGIFKQCDSKKWELTLTPEELQFTINLDHFEPQYFASLSRMQKRYLDIFIFMCLQGTAPIDTKNIKRTDVVRGKLIGDRRKTRTGFKVELDPIAEQILQRYNYELRFVDQAFNEAVKKMFVTIFELYRPYFEDKYEENYILIYTQRKSKGDEEFLQLQHKGLFAEGMTGRRSFITNLNETSNEIGMKENMRKTGHSRIQTHLGYQKDRQTGKRPKSSLFGVSRITPLEKVTPPLTRMIRRRKGILNDLALSQRQ